MRPAKATAQEIAPLVFELARAIRARRIHPAAHPIAVDALRRCAAAWQDVTTSSNEFALEVGEAGLLLADGAPIRGPGAAELAGELQARRVQRLELRGMPSGGELTLLIEALATEPEALAGRGGLAAVLRAADARAVAAVAYTPNRDTSSAADAERNAFLTQHIADLVRTLAELERCDDLASYSLHANRMEVCVDALVRAKRSTEAYRAAVVLSRHATDGEQRPAGIRREASDRLRRLAHDETLVDAVIDQACGASGLASVQASQVLVSIGALAVPPLLRHLEGRKDRERVRATQMLIALGDAALAQVVDELAAQQPERARRAARLLGEMQNPKGVSFLADALRAKDLPLAREAAQALARIGDDAAVQALIGGLALSGDTAESCAGCLGGLRQPAALLALAGVVDARSSQPENVRRAAIRSLGRIGNAEALSKLKRVLEESPFFGAARVRSLRIAAAQAIGQIGGTAAVQVLHAHARGGDSAVRQACLEALRRLERSAGSEK